MRDNLASKLRQLRSAIQQEEARIEALSGRNAPFFDIHRTRQYAADQRMHADGLVIMIEIVSERAASTTLCCQAPGGELADHHANGDIFDIRPHETMDQADTRLWLPSSMISAAQRTVHPAYSPSGDCALT